MRARVWVCVCLFVWKACPTHEKREGRGRNRSFRPPLFETARICGAQGLLHAHPSPVSCPHSVAHAHGGRNARHVEGFGHLIRAGGEKHSKDLTKAQSKCQVNTRMCMENAHVPFAAVPFARFQSHPISDRGGRVLRAGDMYAEESGHWLLHAKTPRPAVQTLLISPLPKKKRERETTALFTYIRSRWRLLAAHH